MEFYRELPLGNNLAIRFKKLSDRKVEIALGDFRYTMQHDADFPREDLRKRLDTAIKIRGTNERWYGKVSRLVTLLAAEAAEIYGDFDRSDEDGFVISFGQSAWISALLDEFCAYNSYDMNKVQTRPWLDRATAYDGEGIGLKDAKELIDYIWAGEVSAFWRETGAIHAIKLLRAEAKRFAPSIPVSKESEDIHFSLGAQARITFFRDNDCVIAAAERRKSIFSEWDTEYAYRYYPKKLCFEQCHVLYDNLLDWMNVDSAQNRFEVVSAITEAAQAALEHFFPKKTEAEPESSKELRVYRRNVTRSVTILNQDVEVKFSMVGIFEIDGVSAKLLRGEIEMPDGTKQELKPGHEEAVVAMDMGGNWMGWERVL